MFFLVKLCVQDPVINYPISTCAGRFSLSLSNPLTFLSCLDAGEQDVTIRLELNNSFDTRKTITISLTLIQALALIQDNVGLLKKYHHAS